MIYGKFCFRFNLESILISSKNIYYIEIFFRIAHAMTRLHVGLEMSHYNKYIDSDKQLQKNNEEVQLAMFGIPRL